jgi:hypothetical protein
MITKTDKDKTKEEKQEIKKKWMIFAFIVTVLIISLTPYLFTEFSIGIDFSETGSIGDTIGGITAPFINIMAALLIFYSFNEQVKANRIQSRSFDDMKIENKDSQLTKIIFEDSKTLLNSIESFSLSSDFMNDISLGRIKRSDNKYGFIGIIEFYQDIFDFKDYEPSISQLDNELMTIMLLNNKIGLLLDHIDMITKDDTKKIHLDRYYYQIHFTFYMNFKNKEGGYHFKDDSTFYPIEFVSKTNVEKYNHIEDSLPKN